jgi:histone deacetylase 1/2
MSRKVAYVYSPDIEGFSYGPDHPMKPKKIAMAHDIIEKSHLLEHMDLYVG